MLTDGGDSTTMFDVVPDALQPNITSSITYDASAPLADAVDAQVR